MTAIYILDESKLDAFGDVLDDQGRPSHLLAAEHLAKLEDAGVLRVLHRCEHGLIDTHPAAYAEVRAKEGDIIQGTVGWCPGANRA